MTGLCAAPISATVLDYRMEKYKWKEGSFSMLKIREENVIILKHEGAQKFPKTIIKPCIVTSKNDIQEEPPRPSHQKTSFVATRRAGNISLESLFERSLQIQFKEILERGTFTLVLALEAGAIRIYGSKFVNTINLERRPDLKRQLT